MEIFIVKYDTGSYSDHSVTSVCAVDTEEKASEIVGLLKQLVEYNQEFAVKSKAFLDNWQKDCVDPIRPLYPAPSEEFRAAQQACSYGKGSPQDKADFRRLQAEHQVKVQAFKKEDDAYSLVRRSLFEKKDQDHKAFVESNYKVPAHLTSVASYLSWDTGTGYESDIEFDYYQLPVHAT